MANKKSCLPINYSILYYNGGGAIGGGTEPKIAFFIFFPINMLSG